MTVVDPRVATDGIRTKLATFGLTVGDGQAPPEVEPPYVVVYPIAGGSTTGTLADLDGDADLVYQVTCVGKTREQAQWLENKVMGLLGVGTVTITGRYVNRISLDGFGGIFRDDKTSPPLFMAVPRFRVLSTPS
jgi:hypothetical protein